MKIEKAKQLLNERKIVYKENTFFKNNMKFSALIVNNVIINPTSLEGTEEEQEEKLYSLIKESGSVKMPNLVEAVVDYQLIKKHLFVKLVNYENNKEMLSTIPYRKIADLAAFVIVQQIIDDDTLNIKANDELLKIWGKTFYEIYQQAVQNMVINNPVSIMSVKDKISEFMGESFDIPEEQKNLQIFVSTQDSINGAYAIFYPNVLSQVCERLHSDKIIILPSSIHEVICIKYTEDDLEYSFNMVCEINHTQVEDVDRLSDNIYFYNNNTGEFTDYLSEVGKR